MRVAQIVYGGKSGIVRRVVVTDSLRELEPHRLGPGEDCIITDPADVLTKTGREVPDLPAAYAMVEAKRGKPSENARVVIFDDKTGEIETVIQADPEIDTLPGKTLYQHDKAVPGWVADATGELKEPPAADAAPAEKIGGP